MSYNPRLHRILLLLLAGAAILWSQTDKLSFWDTQRRGANYFNAVHTQAYFRSAVEAGIHMVRLVPNKWRSRQRDFLIGNADRFTAIDEADYRRLDSVLSQADSTGIAIVLSTLSLPGARWRQQNGDEIDPRLWTDTGYVRQASAFWQDLARRVRLHRSVAAYDILNEPVPELATGYRASSGDPVAGWYARVKRTPADLNAFNAQVTASIREADPLTPVIIECGNWAAPFAIEYLQPLDDPRVLYSFHMYEPFEYTNWKQNQGEVRYPGMLNARPIDSSALAEIIRPVSEWQRRHGIPSTRIFVGEFGCNRRVPGAEHYLGDLIRIFNRNGWHWAFYSFREDEWDGMDYELGTAPLGPAYWKAVEEGRTPEKKRTDNLLWQVLRRGLAGN